MARPDYFYYGTIKNIIAAFGVLFSDIKYVNDWGQTITIPIHYLPKEKFVEIIQNNYDHDNGFKTMVTLPRFGFELTSIDYDSSRMLNPLSKIRATDDGTNAFMFNRVPYNLVFNLYLATTKFEDSLKIAEQIIPFFTPEMNISIKDKEDFNIVTDIPIVMDNSGFSIDWQGPFETRRTVSWDFSFTAKAYLYSNVRQKNRIKETIVNLTNKQFDAIYGSLVDEVIPRDANKHESHIIKETIYEKERLKLHPYFTNGQFCIFDLQTQNKKHTPLSLRDFNSGENLIIEEE